MKMVEFQIDEKKKMLIELTLIQAIESNGAGSIIYAKIDGLRDQYIYISESYESAFSKISPYLI